jgi:hypothetical protein
MKLSILVLVLVAAAGCVYDASDRCGPNMIFVAKLEACLCADNAIVEDLGCKACEPDEVVIAGACGCAPGSAKSADDVCERIAGLGDACASAGDCTNPAYAYCAPGVAGSTCTSTCDDDAGCGDAYTCATWEPQPYCRQFVGLGMSCTSSADCAATDATFCDTYQSHTCIVAGCSLDNGACPRGTMCCDFSQYGFGTLCAAACL